MSLSRIHQSQLDKQSFSTPFHSAAQGVALAVDATPFELAAVTPPVVAGHGSTVPVILYGSRVTTPSHATLEHSPASVAAALPRSSLSKQKRSSPYPCPNICCMTAPRELRHTTSSCPHRYLQQVPFLSPLTDNISQRHTRLRLILQASRRLKAAKNKPNV